jgi:hypothetical protein
MITAGVVMICGDLALLRSLDPKTFRLTIAPLSMIEEHYGLSIYLSIRSSTNATIRTQIEQRRAQKGRWWHAELAPRSRKNQAEAIPLQSSDLTRMYIYICEKTLTELSFHTWRKVFGFTPESLIDPKP